VLVRERRLGRADREFDLYRFRCERTAAAGPRRLDGPVLTRAGAVLRRTGLDDLPQLVNLLKGDISLVGPRPQRPEVLKLLDPGRGLRPLMRPGITGPAQLGALRGPASPVARRDADDYYVRHWSLWLDARIIARTILAAFVSGDRG
jgi:lipopolysaccharide/colanic/teichoic acid biosynthesis glycosyltransferase